MSDDPIITIADVRASGHCVTGAKAWFKIHGMDFKTFLRKGLPASYFAGRGDALSQRIIGEAIKRKGANDGRRR